MRNIPHPKKSTWFNPEKKTGASPRPTVDMGWVLRRVERCGCLLKGRTVAPSQPRSVSDGGRCADRRTSGGRTGWRGRGLRERCGFTAADKYPHTRKAPAAPLPPNPSAAPPTQSVLRTSRRLLCSRPTTPPCSRGLPQRSRHAGNAPITSGVSRRQFFLTTSRRWWLMPVMSARSQITK